MFNIINNRQLELVLSYSNSDTNTISLIDLLTIACTRLNNIINKRQIDDIKTNVQSLINERLEINDIDINQQEYEVIDMTDSEYFRRNINVIYDISLAMVNYNHSTMGRREDRLKQVKEILIIAKLRR